MKQRSGLANMVIGAILLACGVFPATVSAETLIKVGGTGSALGIMKLLAEEYEKSHPGVRVRIMPSLGSTGGIKSLLGGGIDVGLASRPLEETERRQGALAQEYARSPFVFITHPGVNKKDVTTRELEGFFSNPAASWPDGRRIRLILRPEKDIDLKLIRDLSPGMEQAVRAALARPGMILAITDQESTDAVARTPGALGSATLSEIFSGNLKLNVLSFNGVESHAGTMANSSYPLFKTFYLVTTLKSSAEARQFAEFVRSPAAGRILKKTGHLAAAVK
jgi:phosphate transport system substrate-binding protein